MDKKTNKKREKKIKKLERRNIEDYTAWSPQKEHMSLIRFFNSSDIIIVQCSDKLPYFVYLVFKLHIVSYANDSDANAAESKALQLIHTTITLVRVCFLILAWMLPGNGCSTGHLVTGLPGGKVDLRLIFRATHSEPANGR